MNNNKDNFVKCFGEMRIVSELYEGRAATGRTFVNFLARPKAGPLFRVQLWDVAKEEFSEKYGIPIKSLKFQGIRLRGSITGIYDEKVTVVPERMEFL